MRGRGAHRVHEASRRGRREDIGEVRGEVRGASLLRGARAIKRKKARRVSTTPRRGLLSRGDAIRTASTANSEAACGAGRRAWGDRVCAVDRPKRQNKSSK